MPGHTTHNGDAAALAYYQGRIKDVNARIAAGPPPPDTHIKPPPTASQRAALEADVN